MAKQDRERQRQEALRRNAVRKWKKRAYWVIPSLIVVAWIAYSMATAPAVTKFPHGTVHWHADLDFMVCGEQRDIRDKGAGGGHVGGISHTHGDNVLHLEGTPITMESASLQGFFDSIGVPFSERGIFEYSDGEPCEGAQSSELTVYVNDEPLPNASSYVISDRDSLLFVYE